MSHFQMVDEKQLLAGGGFGAAGGGNFGENAAGGFADKMPPSSAAPSPALASSAGGGEQSLQDLAAAIVRGSEPILDMLRGLEAQLAADRQHLQDLHVESKHFRVLARRGTDRAAVRATKIENAHEAFVLQVQGRSFPVPLSFTRYSWSQFLKCSELPFSYANHLIKHGKLHFLSRSLTMAVGLMKDTYLLRLRKFESGTAPRYEIRAILPKHYNRLDNLYIVRALISYLEQQPAQPSGYILQRVACDGDDLYLSMVNPQPRVLLAQVNDKAVSSIDIKNSDIGRFSTLAVIVKFIRLVCTNGMVSNGSKESKIPKRLQALLTSKFYDRLPPDPLPPELQGEINHVMSQAVGECMAGVNNSYTALQKSLEHLHGIAFDLSDPACLRALIEDVLYACGMRTLRGVSINKIQRAVYAELKDFPSTKNTALLIYNALTRYASSNLADAPDDEPPEYSHIEDRSRPRGRPLTALSEGDAWDLETKLLRNSRKLIETGFINWRKTYERAAQKTRTFTPPNV